MAGQRLIQQGQARAAAPSFVAARRAVPAMIEATDFTPATHRLADLCGLTWHPDLLHPDRGTTAVMTASVQQVRAPVHVNALGKWRAHRDLLAPLIATLDPELWPEIVAA